MRERDHDPARSSERGASWLQVYGVSLLCGIGFTMSLFIGGLAFSDDQAIDAVKIGVLGEAIGSALAGYLVLRFAPQLGRTITVRRAR